MCVCVCVCVCVGVVAAAVAFYDHGRWRGMDTSLPEIKRMTLKKVDEKLLHKVMASGVAFAFFLCFFLFICISLILVESGNYF